MRHQQRFCGRTAYCLNETVKRKRSQRTYGRCHDDLRSGLLRRASGVYLSRLCVVRGASDTTFYILAVYFGSVGIVKTRHAVPCGLLADLAGVIAAIFICYLFFG